MVEDISRTASSEDIVDWIDRPDLDFDFDDDDEQTQMVLGHVKLAFVKVASNRHRFIQPLIDHLQALRNPGYELPPSIWKYEIKCK